MAAESRLEGARLTDGADAVTVVELAPDTGGNVSPERAQRVAVAAALHRVHEALRTDPHSFGFFQAVRLLERLQPDRVDLFDGDPAREVVRFRVNPALAFPASEIQQLTLDGGQPVMTVNFLGLTGPMGVLPHQYSLLVSERLRARDGALAEFLDLFHHRLLSLFYQAWRKHRFTIAREAGTEDRLAAHLGDLIGLGLQTARNRQPFPDEALIHRAGLLAGQARGAVALQQLLEDFFDTTIDVQQFVGAWYPIEDHDRCTIGDDDDEGNQLGLGVVVGDEVWDQQARVRVRMGPMPRDQYDAFLPGGASHDMLRSLLRYFSHDQFEFEVQLVLARDDVPGLRLGGSADSSHQLGWSTWICSGLRSCDADETVFTLHSGAAS